ncbi:MAG: plasmid pRiA4b ORF-3 family protein [Desulfovibrio sp.]|nr:plasmid pRiA4b ORF-3 family protein [Desulfovibrio sp.]
MREKDTPSKAKILLFNTQDKQSIFRFDVQLLCGPLTDSFIESHPEPPSRTIDIKGTQTLDDLHYAVFKAFDREDYHMYEFQIGGKQPQARKSVRYGIPDDMSPEVRNALETTIASLNLKEKQTFFYWFDFGDDWWHTVKLLALDPEPKGKGRYPRIVERAGESPPQYADWDAEAYDL